MNQKCFSRFILFFGKKTSVEEALNRKRENQIERKSELRERMEIGGLDNMFDRLITDIHDAVVGQLPTRI